MIKIKGLGNFESLPEVLDEILAENLDALQVRLSGGWDINERIEIDEFIEVLPISFALMTGKFKVVRWLVERGVNLNDKEEPAFLNAVRYADAETVRFIAASGANVNALNRVGSEAFKQAYYGGKREHFALIDELGHSAAKHGGFTLRSAVSDDDYETVKFFLNRGTDVNFNAADQVYPFKPTLLCVAARYGTLKMCKFLVERGADVRLGEKDGMRPYSIALERGEGEMAEYFRSLEPKEFHDMQNKLTGLRKFKLPAALLEFLQGQNLRFETGSEHIKFIEFFGLCDVFAIKIGRSEFVRLSRQTDNYSDLIFIYNHKSKKIAVYDTEHGEMTDIAPFDEFLERTGELIEQKLF